MLTVQNASIGVKLLPLLSSRLEVSKVKLEGAHLNLVSRGEQNNWQDLSEDEGAPAEAGQRAGGSRPRHLYRRCGCQQDLTGLYRRDQKEHHRNRQPRAAYRAPGQRPGPDGPGKGGAAGHIPVQPGEREGRGRVRRQRRGTRLGERRWWRRQYGSTRLASAAAASDKGAAPLTPTPRRGVAGSPCAFSLTHRRNRTGQHGPLPGARQDPNEGGRCCSGHFGGWRKNEHRPDRHRRPVDTLDIGA